MVSCQADARKPPSSHRCGENVESGVDDGKARTELARISHNGIILRVASPENTFTSVIRGDQHYCHGDRQAIGRRLQRFGFARANSPIRRRSYSLVADSADNPQISAA